MRMAGWLVAGLALIVGCWWMHPEQLEVYMWKAALLTSLFWLAYWLDRTAYPYARPHEAPTEVLKAAYQIRRALVILAVVIGGSWAV